MPSTTPAARALLFDLDGTLLHSDALHVIVFGEVFAEHGLPFDEALYLARIHGRHNDEIFAEFFPGEDPARMAADKEARFRDRLAFGTPAMPGAATLFDLAEAKGWRRAVVTNAPRLNAEHMLRAIGLRERVELLVIGDECVRGKPDPAPYLAAMEQLGVSAGQCIAFEDSPSGTRAAAASGAFTIGITSGVSPEGLRAAGADATIADFNDPALAPLLARLDGPQG